MAKSTNGLGQFRGKMGGVVFSVRNGQQIVRTYQPAVSNPKTTLQMLQRAKMNLVGQLSSIMPKEVLIGLGNSAPARRARFLKLNLLKTTASITEGSTIRAKLANSDLVLSEGSIVPVIAASAVDALASAISVTLRILTGFASDVVESSGAIVVAIVQDTNGVYEYVNYRFVQSSEITEETLQVVFPHNAGEGGYYVDVYIVPFRTTDGAKLTTIAESLFGTETDFNAEMSVNPAALPLTWGRSVLSRSATYTPA